MGSGQRTGVSARVRMRVRVRVRCESESEPRHEGGTRAGRHAQRYASDSQRYPRPEGSHDGPGRKEPWPLLPDTLDLPLCPRPTHPITLYALLGRASAPLCTPARPHARPDAQPMLDACMMPSPLPQVSPFNSPTRSRCCHSRPTFLVPSLPSTSQSSLLVPPHPSTSHAATPCAPRRHACYFTPV